MSLSEKSEEEFGKLGRFADRTDALAHLIQGGQDGLCKSAVAVGTGVDAGAAADALRGTVTRMLKGSMMSIGQTSAQRPHMRQMASGSGTKPFLG